MLSGGLSPPATAWAELRKGRRIKAHQIALFIAMDGEPLRALVSALEALAVHYGLDVGIISVVKRNQISISPEGA